MSPLIIVIELVVQFLFTGSSENPIKETEKNAEEIWG